MKNKSSRMVRKADNPEEGGVEESVCSLDGPSAANKQELVQQAAQQAQQTVQQKQSVQSEVTPSAQAAAASGDASAAEASEMNSLPTPVNKSSTQL